MKLLTAATLTNQNITQPLLAATTTAPADAPLQFVAHLANLQTSGLYRACLTRQPGGAGPTYQLPTVTTPVVAGTTTAVLTLHTNAAKDDVIRLYLQSVLGDTTNTAVAVLAEIWDAGSQQAVRDAMELAKSAIASAPGSIAATLNTVMDAGSVTYGQTIPGALAALFDANAIDAYDNTPAVHTDPNGPVAFTAYGIAEFDNDLFVALGNSPAGGKAGVVARIDSRMNATFEYYLPEEGGCQLLASPDGQHLVALGVDERYNTGVSSIYVRNLAGAWVRRHTLTGMQHHVWDGVFVGSRLYVCGSTTGTVAWSDDLGLTWTYGPNLGYRGYGICERNGVLYVRVDTPHSIQRSTDGLTWTTVVSQDTALGNVVNWNNTIVARRDPYTLLTIDLADAVIDYRLPFASYSGARLIIDNAGWLSVVARETDDARSTFSVWRTPDLIHWQRIWSGVAWDTADASREEVKTIGAWGSTVVVATSGSTASIIRRSLSAIHTLGGAVAWTYTLTSAVDAAPIPQARIDVYTDNAMTHLVTHGYTDNFGQVTFYLDPGAYYLRRTKAGWSFTNPDAEIVEEPAL